MSKILYKTAVLVVLFFIPKIVLGSVVINEVLYDPEGTDTGKEYVILYNNGDLPVDLTNWDLDPSSANYFTFPVFTLNAKSLVTIHIGTSGTNNTTDLYDNGSTNMSNTAGPIALFNSTTHSKTTIVDYIEYGAAGQTNESKAIDAGIWTANTFIPDANEGKAIKLKTDGADTNSPSDWTESVPSLNQSQSETESSTSQTQTEQEQTSSITSKPPIAEAGDDIIAFVNQEVKFDATKSTDPDNDELAYSWNMGDGKLVEKPSFTYQYLYPGTYLATLMVYDGRYYVTDTITIKIQAAQIAINEFLPNPSEKDESSEWVEIYNGSETITDISGWQLDDEDGGSKPFVFPQNTLIAPKSYLVFSRQITGIALNNDKDSVRLLLPGGIIFQEIKYENPPQDKSSAKTDEGFVWNIPTPGTANLSLAANSENKKIVYQGTVNTENTKDSTANLAVLYNAPTQEIKGGYTEIAQNEKSITNSQLATVRETISRHISNNLVYILVIVILSGLIIGLLLAKFRKRKNDFV